jgi:hypothetical protein
MTFIEWLKTVWPIGVVLMGVGVRLEVAQALNRQKSRGLEKDLDREREDRKAQNAETRERVSRVEASIDQQLGEIRNDIKTLLSRNQHL